MPAALYWWAKNDKLNNDLIYKGQSADRLQWRYTKHVDSITISCAQRFLSRDAFVERLVALLP